MAQTYPNVTFGGEDGDRMMNMAKWSMAYNESLMHSEEMDQSPAGMIMRHIIANGLEAVRTYSADPFGGNGGSEEAETAWVFDWFGGFVWVERGVTLEHAEAKVQYFSEDMMRFWDYFFTSVETWVIHSSISEEGALAVNMQIKSSRESFIKLMGIFESGCHMLKTQRRHCDEEMRLLEMITAIKGKGMGPTRSGARSGVPGRKINSGEVNVSGKDASQMKVIDAIKKVY